MKRRIISFMMTAVMLIGNMLPATQAYAEEAELPETPPAYRVQIPRTGGLETEYDNNHLDKKDEDGTVTLAYHEGDEVKLTITVADEYELDKIQVLTDDEKDVPVEWASEKTIRFFMPACDVKVHADLHMRPAEVETQPAAPEEAVAEAAPSESQAAETVEDTAAEPVEELQDHPAEEAQDAPDSPSGDVGDGDPAGSQVSEMAEEAGDTSSDQSEEGSDDTEGTAVSEGDEASEAEAFAAPEITLDDDGFPMQGSVIRLSEITIPNDADSIDSEASFAEVNYPQESVSVRMLSNEILYHVPGCYEVMYKAENSGTDRFWYVLRPVRVKEPEEATDM